MAIERRYVNQREYSIIAPLQDINKVVELATFGMGSCFGFAMFDKQAQVGTFSHLDYIEDLRPLFNEVLPQLKELGVTKLQVETANFQPPKVDAAINQLKIKTIEEILRDLQRQHLLLGNHQDVGVHSSVLFTVQAGLVPSENIAQELLAKSFNHFRSYVQHTDRITAAYNGRGVRNEIPVTAVYIPKLSCKRPL
jgi:hypothetical protein